MSNVLSTTGYGYNNLSTFAHIYVTGISKNNEVTLTTPSGKVLTGTGVIMDNPLSHNLPSGYTELEYIQSTGTQYIDLPFLPTIYTTIETKINLQSFASETAIMGCNWSSGGFFLMYYSSVTGFRWHGITTIDAKTPITDFTYDLSINWNEFVDNTDTLSQTSSGSYSLTLGSATAFRVFSVNIQSSKTPVSMKLYSLKIGGDKNYELIPCMNPSGTIGLYDIVNNKFYQNIGTGTFKYGDEIPRQLNVFPFIVKEYGDYSIKATNGSNAAEKKLCIDYLADYTVEINYKRIYLYNYGIINEEATGGFKTGFPQISSWTATSAVFNEDYIQMDTGGQTGTYVCALASNNKISFNGYQKLYISANQKCADSNGSFRYSICSINETGYESNTIVYVSDSTVNSSYTNRLFSLDIDGLEDNYFVCHAGRNEYIQIKAIWLEQVELTTYTWNKYDINTVEYKGVSDNKYSGTQYLSQATGYSTGTLQTFYCTGYTFGNDSTGAMTVSTRTLTYKYSATAGTDELTGSYIQLPDTYGNSYLRVTDVSYSGIVTLNGYFQSVVTTKTVQSQGSTSYGTVTSTKSDAYPTNGIQDGYWYVKVE